VTLMMPLKESGSGEIGPGIDSTPGAASGFDSQLPMRNKFLLRARGCVGVCGAGVCGAGV